MHGDDGRLAAATAVTMGPRIRPAYCFVKALRLRLIVLAATMEPRLKRTEGTTMRRISDITKRVIDGLARGHAYAPLAGSPGEHADGPFSA